MVSRNSEPAAGRAVQLPWQNERGQADWQSPPNIPYGTPRSTSLPIADPFTFVFAAARASNLGKYLTLRGELLSQGMSIAALAYLEYPGLSGRLAPSAGVAAAR